MYLKFDVIIRYLMGKFIQSFNIFMKLCSQKQRQGDHFELLAKQYLEANGLIFVAKNWHYNNLGELDLVMIDNRQTIPCLVIVEVRKRQVSKFGSSLDSITPAKQRKIIKATQAFLQLHEQFAMYDVRFDVVAFDSHGSDKDPEPIWLQSAFIASA